MKPICEIFYRKRESCRISLLTKNICKYCDKFELESLSHSITLFKMQSLSSIFLFACAKYLVWSDML